MVGEMVQQGSPSHTARVLSGVPAFHTPPPFLPDLSMEVPTCALEPFQAPCFSGVFFSDALPSDQPVAEMSGQAVLNLKIPDSTI